MAFAQAAQKNCNWQSDIAVPDAPTDSISAISFSPVSNHLAASSWDNSVRIYQVGNRASEGAQRVGEFKHDAPVLDVCWSHDASKIFSAGVDNAAKAYDVSTGQASTVAMHGAPIKAVRWTEMHNGLLVTAGWDNALQYWDLRTQNPVASLNLEDKCCSMDLRGNLLVAATFQRLKVVDLNNPGAFVEAPTKKADKALPPGQRREFDNQLKMQIRCVAVMPDAKGFAYSGVDGRVAVTWIPAPPTGVSDDYTFRCHRVAKEITDRADKHALNPVPHVFSVNSVAFHPIYKRTCVSSGGDGCFTIWELEQKKKIHDHDLKQAINGFSNYERFYQGDYAVPPAPPITATAFNNMNGGNIFAYAQSYDWAHGVKGNVQGYPNRIMLHELSPDEVQSKK